MLGIFIQYYKSRKISYSYFIFTWNLQKHNIKLINEILRGYGSLATFLIGFTIVFMTYTEQPGTLIVIVAYVVSIGFPAFYYWDRKHVFGELIKAISK